LNSKFNNDKEKYIYNTIVMTDFMLQKIDKDSLWMEKINQIIKQYNISKEKMGFIVEQQGDL
jgi:hypothetical protein